MTDKSSIQSGLKTIIKQSLFFRNNILICGLKSWLFRLWLALYITRI